jgi:hypothetical protein
MWLVLQLSGLAAMAIDPPMISRVPGWTDVQTPDDYMARLNYGVVAIKARRVCVVDGYYTHTFQLRLPRRKILRDDAPVNLTCSSTEVMCRRLTPLTKALETMTVSMRDSITGMVSKVYDLIPDISQVPVVTRRRQQRGLIDGIG